MSGVLILAWRYMLYHRTRSLILMSCIFLTMVLPICLGIVLQTFSQQIAARSEATPVVIGSKGSKLDLSLHAIYFSQAPESKLTFSEVSILRESGLAAAIPLHAKFTAQGYPVVGTSLSYFSFRNLELRSGETLAVLGDCVLGAAVAEELKLMVGDQILTDRGSVLDLAGEYPLKLNIAGVLKRNHSADDHAVFVDLKSAWVIEGLGHGHQELDDPETQAEVIGQDGNRIVASAAVLPYTEITSDNMASFHFHGDQGDFPITALIVDAPDEKSRTILEGRYRSSPDAQLVRPPKEIRKLMSLVFQVKRFFDANAIVVALATAALLGLVVMLSLKLRAREMETMFRLGCSKGTMLWIQLAELGFVFLAASALVLLAVFFVWLNADEIVQQWVGSNA